MEVTSQAHSAAERFEWCAGWSEPKQLPDVEPCDFVTWEGARDALIWELERWDCDTAEIEAAADAAVAELRAAIPGQEFKSLTLVYGCEFWIVAAATPFEEADA